MSKNRKERKVNTLSDLSTVVDRDALPAADQLPEETGAPLPETEETEQHELPEEYIPEQPADPAVVQAIAESTRSRKPLPHSTWPPRNRPSTRKFSTNPGSRSPSPSTRRPPKPRRSRKPR